MTPLDYSQREMMSRSIVHAVARERQRHAAAADELHAAIARERDEMLAEMAKIKAEMLAPWFELQAELARVRDELCKLQMLNAKAQQEREEIWRDRMWADAMLAQRDPTQPLH